MAPRFKQNMYQTYKKDTGADALICFVRWEEKLIFKFRDKLFNKIGGIDKFFLDKSEGEPTPIDSCFQLFAKQHEKRVKSFYKQKPPNIFASLFNTKKSKEYFKEAREIFGLASFYMGTSHDHPCVEIYSSIHSEEELSPLIDTVAVELNVMMVKNRNLPSMADIIMSNRSFDL